MKGSTNSSLRLTVLSFDIKHPTLFYINNVKSSTFDHVVLTMFIHFTAFNSLITITAVCSITQLHCH